MQSLPLYISVIFVLATLYTVYIFRIAAGKAKPVLAILLLWLTIQGVMAYAGFYLDEKGVPPRFVLAIVPALLTILFLFTTAKGRRFIDGLDLSQLSILHLVRVPVEFVLFSLCMYKAVPQVITFEGHNFDIISGITAPVAWYFAKRKTSYRFLLTWNIICLALLINVVVTAVLAAPFDFQQIAFDQPNIAILYFPFVWLPACIVPLVLFSHLASIRQIILKLRTRRQFIVETQS